MSATSANPKLIYRDRLAVWADKYLFVVLFLAGSAGIVAMKVARFNQLVVTAVPVATMVVYGIYVLMTPRYRIRSDRAGDSLYYLGFLYTMVSLAYSLYEFKKSDSDTTDVVTNFGIALATTILGLMLRVVYHQLRDDPFDVEHETRLELSQAASKLHGILMNLVSDFDGVRVTISQVVSEATEESKKRIASVAQQVEETTKLQTEYLWKFTEQAAEEMRQHYSEMLQASRSMTSAVKRIADRIDKVELPPNVIRDRLELIAIPSELIKNRLENVEVPSDLIKNRLEKVDIPSNLIKERIDRVEIPPDIFTARFNGLISQLQSIVTAFSEATARNAGVLQLLENLLKASAEAADRLKLAITTAKTDDEYRRDQLNASLEAFTKAVTSLETTTKALAVLSTSHVEEHKRLLDGLVANAALNLKAVEDHRRQLEDELNSSATAVQRVHGSLVSLTRTVVEKVNGRA